MRALIIPILLLFLASCSDGELHSMNQISKGAQLYKLHCANCHQEDGSGLGKLIPPLKNSDYLSNNPALLPCIIQKGLSEKLSVNGTQYQMAMPAAVGLSAEEIQHISIYVLQKFPATPISIKDTLLSQAISDCKK